MGYDLVVRSLGRGLERQVMGLLGGGHCFPVQDDAGLGLPSPNQM